MEVGSWSLNPTANLQSLISNTHALLSHPRPNPPQAPHCLPAARWHITEIKGASTETGGGLGFETSFVDTTAFIVEVGHRTLIFNEMSYSKAVTTFQGAKAAGDSFTDLLGNKKSLNFSGYTVSVGFRFWL